MLSILIPTYNYNALSLVERLSEEAISLKNPIEIIVLDDGSPNFFVENRNINNLPSARLIQLNENVGRTAAREVLANEAQYSKLLFLDADVLPVRSNFIEIYLAYIDKAAIIFGGITYKTEQPKAEEILRWRYGHAREKLSVAQREKALYSSINSGCFLIEKTPFLEVSKTIQENKYGMDLVFKQRLEHQQLGVLHIDNPVYHLGLEPNEQFLKKSLQAIKTTVFLENRGELQDDSRKIQKTYLRLKKYGMLGVFQAFFNTFQSQIEGNLRSPNPNLQWFDLYRLNYYIQLKKENSA
jgi:glycosyltransferase involved in cell wall biosynthesis